MILAYRNFRSQVGTCIINISKEGMRDDAGQIIKVIERWMIQGQLLYNTPSEVKSKTTAMEQAFAADGGDLVLYFSDGRTPSAHALYSRQTFSGVKVVVPPSFPKGEGIEAVTMRTFYVELEAEKLPQGANKNILRFQESISVRGGGRRQKLLETALGVPEIQIVRQQTICYVTQQGSAVGLYRQPIVPNAILPQYLVDEFPDYQVGSGRYNGSLGSVLAVEIPVSWRYEMELPFRLFNPVPNVWTE